MDASRHDARLRAAEKRVAQQWARWRRAMRKRFVKHSWRQRLDASIDPALACAACLMLAWLLHKWL